MILNTRSKPLALLIISLAFCLGASGQMSNILIQKSIAKENKVKTVASTICYSGKENHKDSCTVQGKFFYDKNGNQVKYSFYNNDTVANCSYYQFYNKSGRIEIDSIVFVNPINNSKNKYTYAKNGKILKKTSIVHSDSVVYLYEYRSDTVFENTQWKKSKGWASYPIYILDKKGKPAYFLVMDYKDKPYVISRWVYNSSGNVSEIYNYDAKGIMPGVTIFKYDKNNLPVEVVYKETDTASPKMIIKYTYEYYK